MSASSDPPPSSRRSNVVRKGSLCDLSHWSTQTWYFLWETYKHLTNLRCSSDFTSSRINACLTLPSATLKHRWWLVRGTFGPGTYDPRINFPTFIFLATSFLVPEFPQIAKTPWVISSITYDDGDDNNHDVWWMLATLTLSWTSSPMTSPLSSSRSMPSVFTISLIVPPCTKITVRA